MRGDINILKYAPGHPAGLKVKVKVKVKCTLIQALR